MGIICPPMQVIHPYYVPGIFLEAKEHVIVEEVAGLYCGGLADARGGAGDTGDGELKRPTGMGIDQDLNLIVADWANERVQLLGPDGRFIAVYHGEAEISKWAQEYLNANPVERDARLVSDMEPELDPNDLIPNYLNYHSESIEKLFMGPMSVKIDEEGRVYILESLRHRIQIYRWCP